MKTETNNTELKTTIQVIGEKYGINFTDEKHICYHVSPNKITELMHTYARSVAEKVRQECADKASANLVLTISGMSKEFDENDYNTEVEKDSILNVDIEQFLK